MEKTIKIEYEGVDETGAMQYTFYMLNPGATEADDVWTQIDAGQVMDNHDAWFDFLDGLDTLFDNLVV